jgi:hypothetical protein
LLICRSAEETGTGEAVGVSLGGLGGLGVAVNGGKNMTVLVGSGTLVGEFVITGMLVLVFVFVGAGVLVSVGRGGRVAKEAPGVRKTSNQAGLVRMDGSRGSKKLSGTPVRNSLSGLRFDPMSAGSLQLGAKRNAHPLLRIIQMNPNSRISNISTMDSRLSFSRSRVFIESPVY